MRKTCFPVNLGNNENPAGRDDRLIVISLKFTVDFFASAIPVKSDKIASCGRTIFFTIRMLIY